MLRFIKISLFFSNRRTSPVRGDRAADDTGLNAVQRDGLPRWFAGMAAKAGKHDVSAVAEIPSYLWSNKKILNP
jgi:hypothetical protein